MSTPALKSILNNSAAKKRKIRKGTFSCWECKRRKTRCELKAPSEDACVSCQRHGVSCVTQEFEEYAGNDVEAAESRLSQLEELVEQLVQQRQPDSFKRQQLRDRRNSINPDNIVAPLDPLEGPSIALGQGRRYYRRCSPLPLLALGEDFQSKCRSMSSYLRSMLPHPTTAARIATAGASPFAILEQPDRIRNSRVMNTEQSEREAHPVFVARDLIQLALCLERLDVNTSEHSSLQSQDSRRTAARRYVHAAQQVTSQPGLVKSLEGVETLMLEGSYLTGIGNVQGAWLSFRRAISIAQLFSLQQEADNSNSRASLVWFRLIYFDRILSLMLGLSFSVAENAFQLQSPNQFENPSGQLDHIHLKASSRIISRNLRMQRRLDHSYSTNDTYDDMQETHYIEHELKQASRALPPTWWFQPDKLDDIRNNTKLISQMHQYHLIVLLHLPYLIQGAHIRSPTICNDSKCGSADSSYSPLVAVGASCELLSRFLLLYSTQHTPRTMSGNIHKVYTASLSILLAHIDGHRFGDKNVLEVKRATDLKLINDTINNINHIVDSSQSYSNHGDIIQILTTLLDIENEASNGHKFVVRSGKDENEGAQSESNDEDIRLRFSIPYFGLIRIIHRNPRHTSPSEPGGTSHLPIVASGGILDAIEDNAVESVDVSNWSTFSATFPESHGDPDAVDEFEAFFDFHVSSGQEFEDLQV